MSYPATPTRFVHVVGWCGTTMLWWGEDGTCRPGLGHIVRGELRRGEGPSPDNDVVWAGYEEWDPGVGALCESCGTPFPGLEVLGENVKRSAGNHPTYDTESGEAEPGCMFWRDWDTIHHQVPPILSLLIPGIGSGLWCSFNRWTNCDGRHLIVVLPNGHQWDVDSRANNCDHPDDTTHRCWVRSGNPETEPVTTGKDGPTCTAGAGSILSGDYHGYLRDGILTAG